MTTHRLSLLALGLCFALPSLGLALDDPETGATMTVPASFRSQYSKKSGAWWIAGPQGTRAKVLFQNHNEAVSASLAQSSFLSDGRRLKKTYRQVKVKTRPEKGKKVGGQNSYQYSLLYPIQGGVGLAHTWLASGPSKTPGSFALLKVFVYGSAQGVQSQLPQFEKMVFSTRWFVSEAPTQVASVDAPVGGPPGGITLPAQSDQADPDGSGDDVGLDDLREFGIGTGFHRGSSEGGAGFMTGAKRLSRDFARKLNAGGPRFRKRTEEAKAKAAARLGFGK